MTSITISNEAELFEAIDLLLEEIEAVSHKGISELSLSELSIDDIIFDGWPNLNITIKGKKFNGGLPIRLMNTLVAYQKIIDRAYARSLGRKRARLNQSERDDVELIAHFSAGSTSVDTKLFEALSKAVVEAVKNMSSAHLVITILGAAAIVGTTVVWTAGIHAGVEEAKLNQEMEERRIESDERLATIAHLVGVISEVGTDLKDMTEARDSMFQSMNDQDQLYFGGEYITDGQTANYIYNKTRPKVMKHKLDGKFLILAVETGKLKNGFRIRLRDIESGEVFTALIAEGTLSDEEIAMLQNAEWKKSSVKMRIDIVAVGSRIRRAKIVSVNVPK